MDDGFIFPMRLPPEKSKLDVTRCDRFASVCIMYILQQQPTGHAARISLGEQPSRGCLQIKSKIKKILSRSGNRRFFPPDQPVALVMKIYAHANILLAFLRRPAQESCVCSCRKSCLSADFVGPGWKVGMCVSSRS